MDRRDLLARQRRNRAIEQKLHDLLMEQRRENQSYRIPLESLIAHIDRDMDSEELVNILKQDPFFRDLYRTGFFYLLKPRNEMEYHNVPFALAGRIFAEMAFRHLSASNTQTSTLLSRERTDELFDAMHPDDTLIRYPFGFTSYPDTWKPDGVVVSDQGGVSRVVGSYEYSAHPDPSKFKGKEHGHAISQRHFGRLFSGSELAFVGPHTFFDDIPPFATRGYNLKEVPLHNNHLARLVRIMNSRYDEYGTSLSAVADRLQVQAGKDDPIPPPDMGGYRWHINPA